MAAQEKRKEFCEILGVEEEASKEEIKRAYKQLALQCHPDKNQLNPEATKEFQKISEAYTGLCQEDIDSADEDINDFDGGVSLLELLQLFFSISRRKPFFMRSPSSWFSHYSEDSDDVIDSDDAGVPVRQNIRNHAGQQSWNDDNHFVPGNARQQSPSKDTGKTGKTKKRKNRRGGGAAQSQNNQSSERQGMTGAGTNAGTGSNTSARTNAGTAENRTSTLDSDRLATEATSENQLPGRAAGVSGQAVNQDSDTKPGIVPNQGPDNNNSGENLERRGSNGSLQGAAQMSQGQAVEKKPNKKKLETEQRIREKEYAEIHRAVLEKNQREEEKRKKKAEKERAKLDMEFTPKLNAMTQDENKSGPNDRMPEIDPSAERHIDQHGSSVYINDTKDPETSDSASLDSDARRVKEVEGVHSLESSETTDSIGIEALANIGRTSNDRKVSSVSFEREERSNENHLETGCNGDAVGSNHNEHPKFTRVFYGHSSKNQNKPDRYNHNFDNAEGANYAGSRFPPQRGSGYRGRADNANRRPHASNSGFIDRSFYRGFHNNSERDGPLSSDDRAGCTSEDAGPDAGFMGDAGRVNRGQNGRGRYRGNRMRFQNNRSGNVSEPPGNQSTIRDGPSQDTDGGNDVGALDVKVSGDRTSLESTEKNDLPNVEIQSQRVLDEQSGQEGRLPFNGQRGGHAQDNSDTSRRGYWPRSNRNFKGQRGNFRGGFDGGGGRNGGDNSGGVRTKQPVQECWDTEESASLNCAGRADQLDGSAVEVPVAERGKGQHRGRRPDRGGFQRGGGRGGRAFNSSNSQENWDQAGGRSGNQVDQVEGSRDAPVHEVSNEPYCGGRTDRGQFQRDGRGRGRGKGFVQARDRMGGEAQQRGGNRTSDWEPGKKRFERRFSSTDDCEEYNGATMQFHRRKQTPAETGHVPAFTAPNASTRDLSPPDSAAASDGMVWTRRSSEGHLVDGERNVWKDRKEFYEGALPRSKEEEDAMLRAALQLSELEIEEQRLAEQVQRANRSLSFISSSVAIRPSEAAGWTADVLDIVTVEPHPPQQRLAEKAATNDVLAGPEPQNGRADDDDIEIGERLLVPPPRSKSWADEMEETNDTGANADACPRDSFAESDADLARSPCLPRKTAHNSGSASDAVSSQGARDAPAYHAESEIRAGDEMAHPTVVGVSHMPAMQSNRAVSNGVVRPAGASCALEQLREPLLRRQTSMLDDIDDGVELNEDPQKTLPINSVPGAASVESREGHFPSFPPIARHLSEPDAASDLSGENDRRSAGSDLPNSPGLPCPAFPPGPMPHLPPWMQPGCPAYFFAVPGYPPWYPMPPYQHYWPCMPSGAPAMPGVMPMASQQSLGLAHSSDQPPAVSQVLPMPLPNRLPLQGHSAVPGLPPSMPTMLHPIPFGYPQHPAHFAPPGAAMHVPFAPYPLLPSDTVDPTAPSQETGLPTNYTDESKRCA